MNHGRKFVVSFLLLSILMLPRLAAAQANQPAILQVQNNGTTAGTAANFFKLNFTTGCTTTFSSGVFSIACTGGAGNPGGSANQIQYNNAGTSFAGLTMTGDCTIVVATGAITCTETSGTPFGPFATVTGLTGVIYGNGSSAPTVASTTQFGTALNAYLATLSGCTTASYVFVPATPNCVAQSGGSYTFDAPIVNTSGTVSLQNSTPANITALTGTDTLIPTNSGAFTSGHSVIADANGGIADSGSANVTAASTTTFTNKSIAGSEVNSGLVASTVGGTGVNNSVTLTLGTTARNYATLGTGFEYNTTTTGAATDATAAQLGALINIAQYDVLVSGGTAAAVAGVAPGSTSGLPFVSQGASSNPTFAALALTALATQTNATFLSNVSGSTAAPSANALPTTANALIKTSNSNGALAASTVSDGGSGVTVGSPTGGAEGAGTLNATGLYINGSAVGTGGPGTGTQYTHPYWSTTSALGSVAPTTGYDGVPQVETNSTTSECFYGCSSLCADGRSPECADRNHIHLSPDGSGKVRQLFQRQFDCSNSAAGRLFWLRG